MWPKTVPKQNKTSLKLASGVLGSPSAANTRLPFFVFSLLFVLDNMPNKNNASFMLH